MPKVRRLRLPYTPGGPDFMKFWAGETISFFGSQVTQLALPLTAVLVLKATPQQMGLMTASRTLPFLVFGLMAGVWVDRLRRRRILIASDLARGLLLVSIPVAATLGVLRMGHLYAISFLLGSITVVAAVAYQSFIPTLVTREHLVLGNSRLEVSNSAAAVAGPGLGGLLVQWLTAPIAILVDAVSFFVSAVLLMAIGTDEAPPSEQHASRSARHLIREGLEIVLGHPLLRGIVACGTIHNFFSRMIDALYILYLVNVLHLNPFWIGAVAAAGGIGAVAGALLAAPASSRLGTGRACIWAQVLTGLSRLLIPLARGPFPVVVGVLALAEIALGIARPVFNVNQVSLRLSLTEDHQHGRVNASMRFIMWSVTPVGAALGGWLAGVIGLRPTLFGAGAGVLLAFLAAWASPLRFHR